MGGILRRVSDAQALAHRVVELRGIQPDMRVSEREPMRHQAGTRGAKRQTSIVIRRGSKCLIEQRQQWLRRRQRNVALSHQGLCECGDTHGVGHVGTQFMLMRDGIQCGADALGERLG